MSLAGVVDIDRGIVSREIFVDEGVYGQERTASTSTLQQRVLRAWAPSP